MAGDEQTIVELAPRLYAGLEYPCSRPDYLHMADQILNVPPTGC